MSLDVINNLKREIDYLNIQNEKLEKENRRLFMEKTHAKIDAEEVEDNAFDYAVGQQIFYGEHTQAMLKFFLEDFYDLYPNEEQ